MINNFNSSVNYRRSYIAHCQSGYYCYDRKVYVAERLRDMPSAQAGIIYTENGVQLVSYETIVAEIRNNWIRVYGMFSRSTGKHIKAFLNQFTPFHDGYYFAKKLAESKKEYSLITGMERDMQGEQIMTIGTRV